MKWIDPEDWARNKMKEEIMKIFKESNLIGKPMILEEGLNINEMD